MLALTVKRGEAVIIRHGGEEIEVRIGERFRVYFDGPQSFEVIREELIGGGDDGDD